ncbi:protein maelstrom homolog isoform X2 [Rhynchophorus ferrugineus]|uniref:protein maelstrom homolog isoform X1 n=1 Tax=Rhynchophorus ferrugineus TaxID=354439 RepID=UPI003FCDA3FD
MASKKKAKPNGFLLFALDLQKQDSIKYPSIKEAREGAAPIWSKMPFEKRKSYDEKAKQMKGGKSTNLTSEGVLVDTILKQKKEKDYADQKAKNDIYEVLSVAYAKGELATKEFFVIDINIFCHCETSNRYYPAEISVLKFNIKDGVVEANLFYSMVDSGPLPAGYKCIAKSHSDMTHLLPVPFEKNAPDNQKDVYHRFKAFLQNVSGDNMFPIIYGDTKNVDICTEILNRWCQEFDNIEGEYKIYNFQYLLNIIKNIVSKSTKCIPYSLTDRLLEKDVYSHVHDIACRFHKTTSKPQYCCRSAVIRYVYVLCDCCCDELNIDPIPDQHTASSMLQYKNGLLPFVSGSCNYAPSNECESAFTSTTYSTLVSDCEKTVVTSSGSNAATFEQEYPPLIVSQSGNTGTSDESDSWKTVKGKHPGKYHRNRQ